MTDKRSRPERRRTPAQQVLRPPRAASLFGGVRRPLHAALDRLTREQGAIDTAWRRLLRRLSPSREEFDAVSRLGLLSHLRELRSGDYEAYAEALRREGETLARHGVSEEHAIAAVAFHLEACLSLLLRSEVDPKSVALALVRLTAVIQRFALRGYADLRTTGWRRIDEQERLKLSRDLHDEVGADLVVLKLYIEMMAMELAKGNVPRVEAKLREALSLIAKAIDSVRRLTLDLGPAILEQIGFLPAVRLYARQFSERTGIRIQFSEAGLPASIPTTHETALYRVLQGALSNVAKHARARSVRVTLGGVRDAVVVMIVEDDGAGFDPDRGRQGFGLTAMRDRIQSLGGRLHVDSRGSRAPGGRSGTRIEIDLPLKGGDKP